MRPIRQSDIEIARAEVAILRSLGMEPDRAALLLAQLDAPPVVEDRAGEPAVAPRREQGSSEVLTASEPPASDAASDVERELDIEVPPSNEPTFMRFFWENTSEKARSSYSKRTDADQGDPQRIRIAGRRNYIHIARFPGQSRVFVVESQREATSEDLPGTQPNEVVDDRVDGAVSSDERVGHVRANRNRLKP